MEVDGCHAHEKPVVKCHSDKRACVTKSLRSSDTHISLPTGAPSRANMTLQRQFILYRIHTTAFFDRFNKIQNLLAVSY